MPFLAALDHERGNDGMVGEMLFHLLDLPQIVGEGAVGDQFDVVEARHAGIAVIDGTVPTRNIDHRHAEGLPNRAAPARVEGFHHLITAVCRRRGSQPKWIRCLDSREIDA